MAAGTPVSIHNFFQPKLSELLATWMAANNMLGRYHVLSDAQKKIGSPLQLSTAAVSQFDDVQPLGFESVPFTAAIDRIRNLTPMTKLAFDGLRQQYQQQAFTVAGVSDVRMIDRIQQMLTDTLQSGGSTNDFIKQAQSLAPDLLDWQLATVFQTNFASAYSNGRLAMLRDPAVMAALPYWQYHTAEDTHVRPAHAVLDGFVAQASDAVWRKIYPPWGYNCRCSVSAIGPEDAPKNADESGMSRLPSLAAADEGFGGNLWQSNIWFPATAAITFLTPMQTASLTIA